MSENIKPTTKPTEGEETIFTLEDKDYLLIKAIQDLTNQTRRLANK